MTDRVWQKFLEELKLAGGSSDMQTSATGRYPLGNWKSQSVSRFAAVVINCMPKNGGGVIFSPPRDWRELDALIRDYQDLADAGGEFNDHDVVCDTSKGKARFVAWFLSFDGGLLANAVVGDIDVLKKEHTCNEQCVAYILCALKDAKVDAVAEKYLTVTLTDGSWLAAKYTGNSWSEYDRITIGVADHELPDFTRP